MIMKKMALPFKATEKRQGEYSTPSTFRRESGEGKQVQNRYEVQYYPIIFKVQWIPTSKTEDCILLIIFIVSLVLLPVTAYLLISSFLPHAPLAYTSLPPALPFPPSGCASQAPIPVTHHPIHGLWHCSHLIFCHFLPYLPFQFCLSLLGSPSHLHHCLLSFCPLFLFIISSLSLAALSLHLLLTLHSHLSLISPSVLLPNSLQCLSPQHHTTSFYCFMCYFPVPLSPSPMVP